MISVRKANERGHADHGWLKTYHTFSFGSYRDLQQMGFRSLRVMNEDRVAPGKGFGTHPHRDMEIVSYVLAGELQHQDSMGHGAILQPGEFQRITAGTGITHSEFNPSPNNETHFYQIWLTPEQKGLAPSYEQKSFPPAARENQLQLVAAPSGRANALKIYQDVDIYLADLSDQHTIRFELRPSRYAWVQVLRGDLELNEVELQVSDGAAIQDEQVLEIRSPNQAEIMLFDLS